jgi:hypothetical protein
VVSHVHHHHLSCRNRKSCNTSFTEDPTDLSVQLRSLDAMLGSAQRASVGIDSVASADAKSRCDSQHISGAPSDFWKDRSHVSALLYRQLFGMFRECK